MKQKFNVEDQASVIEMLVSVAQGLRHKHYKRTVDKARFYMALKTGEDLDEYVPRFEIRETKETYEARLKITTHISKSVLAGIQAAFQKVDRVKHNQALYYTDEAGEGDSQKIMAEILSKFWGNASLDTWIETRWLELDSVDPNAWVVVEWETTDGSSFISPYPYEIPSKRAVYYQRADNNQVLDALVAEIPAVYVTDLHGDRVKKNPYTAYLKNRTVNLRPVNADAVRGGIPEVDTPFLGTYLGEPAKLVYVDRQPYLIEEPPPHDVGFVPAFRCSYKRDLKTAGDTMVPHYDAATELITKQLGINSMADQTKHTTAFPLVIRASEDCGQCTDGYTTEGGTCAVCHGTGKKAPRPLSAMQEIVVDVPHVGDENGMPDLDKLLIFKSPEISLLEYQDKVIADLRDQAKMTIFNGDIFSKSVITETATGAGINLQNVYDELSKCASAKALAWAQVVDTVAKAIGRDEGLVRYRIYPSDFQMLGLDDLLNRLKKALDSGSGPDVISSVEEQIRTLIFMDNPSDLRRNNVMALFNPFRGASPPMLSLVMASDALTPRRHRVQYANLVYIFDKVEAQANEQGEDFYALAYAEQKRRIDAEVDILMEQTATAAPALNFGE